MGDGRRRRKSSARNVLLVGPERSAGQAEALLQGAGAVVIRRPSMPASLQEVERRVDLVLFTPNARSLPPCDQVKASQEGFLPVMVVLDPQSTVNRAEILQAGADDVLTGFPDAEEFRLRVANWMRIKRTHDGLRERAPLGRPTQPPAQIAQPSPERSPHVRVTLHGLIETRLRAEHARAMRHQEPLAFALFAVDDAKHLFERFGNDTVNTIAGQILFRLEECFREGDEVTRTDSLGFGAILPHTHFEGALAVTARAHKRISGDYELDQRLQRISISVGVALFPSPQVSSYRDLGSVAQLGAVEALAAGGNRICIVQKTGYMFTPHG